MSLPEKLKNLLSDLGGANIHVSNNKGSLPVRLLKAVAVITAFAVPVNALAHNATPLGSKEISQIVESNS